MNYYAPTRIDSAYLSPTPRFWPSPGDPGYDDIGEKALTMWRIDIRNAYQVRSQLLTKSLKRACATWFVKVHSTQTLQIPLHSLNQCSKEQKHRKSVGAVSGNHVLSTNIDPQDIENKISADAVIPKSLPSKIIWTRAPRQLKAF